MTTKTPRTGRPRKNDATGVSGPVTASFLSRDRIDFLLAAGERLTQQVDDPHTHARDLAALMRQLREIDDQIADLEGHQEEADPVAQAANTDDEAYE